jgi:hypothetical protein
LVSASPPQPEQLGLVNSDYADFCPFGGCTGRARLATIEPIRGSLPNGPWGVMTVSVTMEARSRIHVGEPERRRGRLCEGPIRPRTNRYPPNERFRIGLTSVLGCRI